MNMSKNSIFLSSGCFTGRINGRDPHLLSRYYDKIESDGFELMLFDDLYPNIKSTVSEYLALNIPIRIIHMNKRIGDLLSTPGEENLHAARELLKRDMEITLSLGACRGVYHPWGIPDSDKYPEMLTERILSLFELGDGSGVELLPENCVCVNADPLKWLLAVLKQAPGRRVTVDTRAAAFHGQLSETLEKLLLCGGIGHFHIIDYIGAPLDWEARKNIPQPGDGGIDWQGFFAALNNSGYRGTVTMESPHMLTDSVDYPLFNKSLEFIRKNLNS